MPKERRQPVVGTDSVGISTPSVDCDGFLARIDRKRRITHEDALPVASAITSFVADVQKTSGFYDSINEHQRPKKPYSQSNPPDYFDFTTKPKDGNVYVIDYDGRKSGKRLTIRKCEVAEGDKPGVILESTILEVHQVWDGLYSYFEVTYHMPTNRRGIQINNPEARVGSSNLRKATLVAAGVSV